MSTKSIKYHLLQPSYFRLDGGAMFGIIPRPMWQKVATPDEMNRIDLALRLWVIETKNRLILVDSGIGDYHGDKFDQRFDVRGPKSPLENALQSIGKSAQDVTDFVISHLHFDHVGGMVRKLEDGDFEPILKNATCYLHQSHFEYAQKPSQRDAGSFHQKYFMPAIEFYKAQGKLKFLKQDQGVLLQDENYSLNYRISHGHTPYLMHPYDDQLIYMTDLIPTSNHVHVPWVMGYDINPATTTEYKENFLDFVYQNNLTMIYEHDPIFWGSKIEKGDRGFKVKEERKATREASVTI